MKMPQLNRKYLSGTAKGMKEKESIKAGEKCKGLQDRFVVISCGIGEPTEKSAFSSIQVVNFSYACLVHNQMCHTQHLKFCKNEVIFFKFICLRPDMKSIV